MSVNKNIFWNGWIGKFCLPHLILYSLTHPFLSTLSHYFNLPCKSLSLRMALILVVSLLYIQSYTCTFSCLRVNNKRGNQMHRMAGPKEKKWRRQLHCKRGKTNEPCWICVWESSQHKQLSINPIFLIIWGSFRKINETVKNLFNYIETQ